MKNLITQTAGISGLKNAPNLKIINIKLIANNKTNLSVLYYPFSRPPISGLIIQSFSNKNIAGSENT